MYFYFSSPLTNIYISICTVISISSKTMTKIISRSRSMSPQSPPFTIGETVLKESDDPDILGVTFESTMTFERHLRPNSMAAFQKISILKKF